MRMRPTATLLIVFGLASGFAFALPAIDASRGQDGASRRDASFPEWVTDGKPGTGPVFIVRGRVGSGDDALAGYAWLAELERFHLAWGGAVAGSQDAVFMIEAPDHARLDALLASSPWSSVSFTVEPLVRTKDRLARIHPSKRTPPTPVAEPETTGGTGSGVQPTRPIADPNHGDGTTHPAP
jgi:hypothetical protein